MCVPYSARKGLWQQREQRPGLIVSGAFSGEESKRVKGGGGGQGRNLYIKIGDKEVECHKNFRLFLHTKLNNPHYPPEIQVRSPALVSRMLPPLSLLTS